MFFIVLDLRLTKVGVQRYSFFYALLCRGACPKTLGYHPTVMLTIVKHLNASLCANRFLTSFEMTGKKEIGKQFSDSLGVVKHGVSEIQSLDCCPLLAVVLSYFCPFLTVIPNVGEGSVAAGCTVPSGLLGLAFSLG